jgi:hypothetical protein
MLTPKIDSKAIYRLKKLVGYECTVRLRSSPETVISGILDSFDFDCIPSILNVDCGDRGMRVINFQDVSFIEETRSSQ